MTHHSVKLTWTSAAVSVAIMSSWATVAKAQDPTLETGEAAESAESAENKDHIILGLGVGVQPTYEGSKKYKPVPLPAIDIKEGWFFANLKNGIGIAPIDNDFVTLGASITYVPGYSSSDVPHGINNLSDAAGARVFAIFRAYGFVANLGATDVVTGGTKGFFADASLSYPIKISDSLSLIPTVGTTWANRKYNDRYFGVTSAESVDSGLSQFSVGSGFKDVSGFLTANYRLTDDITLSATAGVTTLVGDVSNSPLVDHKTQPSGFLSASYHF